MGALSLFIIINCLFNVDDGKSYTFCTYKNQHYKNFKIVYKCYKKQIFIDSFFKRFLNSRKLVESLMLLGSRFHKRLPIKDEYHKHCLQ